MIRKAVYDDIIRVSEIYEDIHTDEEAGKTTTGWIRGIYPVYDTAKKACENNELYVMEKDGEVVAAARFNKIQDDMYSDGQWQYEEDDDRIMVMHTLVVSPSHQGKGYAKEFAAFYEDFAKSDGCTVLRIDTNERNTGARKLYKKLGYSVAGIVPCDFNGLVGVRLVLLEKKL